MAARWYISRIVGTGTDDDPYRARVADHIISSHSSVIPSNADGTPARAWALVRVDADDHTPLQNDTDIEDLFDDDRDAALSTVPFARRQRIAAIAGRLGTNLTVGEGVLAPNVKKRLLIRALGRALDSSFSEDGLG